MNALDQLGLLAEIAATYTGFIAVFLAFSERDGRFSPADAHFIQGMVLSCLAVIALSLAPRVCSLVLPPESVWLICSRASFVLLVPMLAYIGWRQIRMPQEEAAQVHYLWHVPGWALAAAALLFYAAAALDSGSAAGLYLAGTSLGLGIAVWAFVAIVFRKFF